MPFTSAPPPIRPCYISWNTFLSNMDRFSCLIAFSSSFSSSSGFNGTPRRRQSWRPRCRRLRTPSQRPSSSYHNWTESTRGGTHRLVGLVLCLCATEFGNDGWVDGETCLPHESNRGWQTYIQTYRQTDRRGDASCCFQSPQAVSIPLCSICLHLN